MKFWTKRIGDWNVLDILRFTVVFYAFCIAIYAVVIWWIDKGTSICNWFKTKLRRLIPKKIDPEDSTT